MKLNSKIYQIIDKNSNEQDQKSSIISSGLNQFCKDGEDIGDENTCLSAYCSLEAKFKYGNKRRIISKSWPRVPKFCSVQYQNDPDGFVEKNKDCSPHYKPKFIY